MDKMISLLLMVLILVDCESESHEKLITSMQSVEDAKQFTDGVPFESLEPLAGVKHSGLEIESDRKIYADARYKGPFIVVINNKD